MEMALPLEYETKKNSRKMERLALLTRRPFCRWMPQEWQEELQNFGDSRSRVNVFMNKFRIWASSNTTAKSKSISLCCR
jgi:hypothetical protein